MDYYPEVVQVVPFEDYTVDVYFSDGKIVCYDAEPLVGKGVFAVLSDKKFFIERCTVLNDTLAWDIDGDRNSENCLDIDPIMLHSLPDAEERTA